MRSHIHSALVLAVLGVLISSCSTGGGGEEGGNGAVASPYPTYTPYPTIYPSPTPILGGSLDSSQSQGSNSFVVGSPVTSDDQALAACFAKWSNVAFTQGSTIRYNKIDASMNILGMGGVSVDDTNVTNYSQVILINTAFKLFGNSIYNLSNPQGWYCINNGLTVTATITANLKQTARLADTSTGSSTGGAVTSNVNVGPSITVNLVP